MASATVGGLKADHPLYGIGRALERAGETVGLIRAEKILEYRVQEYDDLAQKNRLDARPELETEIEVVRERVKQKIFEDAANAGTTVDTQDDLKAIERYRKVEEIMSRHLERLMIVQSMLPPQAQFGISHAINKTQAALSEYGNQTQAFIQAVEDRTQQTVELVRENNKEHATLKQRIGGQTDEHGCITPAGYSWCEIKQKCLRTWEEECA